MQDGECNVQGNTNLLPAHVEPFPCKIIVWSPAHADLIEREWRETEPELDKAMP